jgi:hypothetical protein
MLEITITSRRRSRPRRMWKRIAQASGNATTQVTAAVVTPRRSESASAFA